MSDLAQGLAEVFERFGPVESRRMFGGHGIYHQGRMFGLVARGTLYLKSDAQNVAEFDRLRLPAFEFARGDKMMRTSYRQAPPELFEDREVAARWARLAWEAAQRSSTGPKRPRPSQPRPRRTGA